MLQTLAFARANTSQHCKTDATPMINLLKHYWMWGALLLGLGACMALLLWLKPINPPELSPEMASVSSVKPVQALQLPPNTVVLGELPVLAPALQNTVIDCPIKTQPTGLMVSRAVRTCFDYFLSAGTDVPRTKQIADTQQYLNATLTGKAAQTALRLLDQYTDWQDAERVANPATNTQDAHQLQAGLIAAAQRRQRFFSAEEAKAFFGEEDPAIAFTLRQLSIMTNDQLTPSQKAAQIARLINHAPADVDPDMRTTLQLASVAQLTHDLTGQRNGDIELRIIRQQLLGTEAANSLNALDDARNALRQQLTHYLDARAQLIQNSPEDQRDAAVKALRERTYSDTTEQARAIRYEALRDRGEPINF
jgi:lipase chaperone LimK